MVHFGNKQFSIVKQESAKVVPESMLNEQPETPFLERSDLFIDPKQEATAQS